MKKKININTDRAIGLSAMLISLLTLIIFLYQTNLLEKQSRLSVRPRLSFSKDIKKSITFNDADSTNATVIRFTLTLRNDGLGPAIIESNRVIDKGKSYNILTFFDEAYPKLREYSVITQITELKVGEAIPESKTIALFSYEYNLENENKINSYLAVSESYELPFDVLIEYSSMYEEKWRVSAKSKGHPEKIM